MQGNLTKLIQLTSGMHFIHIYKNNIKLDVFIVKCDKILFMLPRWIIWDCFDISTMYFLTIFKLQQYILLWILQNYIEFSEKSKATNLWSTPAVIANINGAWHEGIGRYFQLWCQLKVMLKIPNDQMTKKKMIPKKYTHENLKFSHQRWIFMK